MSDLEQQLTGTLAQVAEDAPGAAGLAGAARRRHRVRRQRRLALGGGAIALVVGLGAVVVGGLGSNDRATDPVDDPAPEGWQTISQEDVRAQVPADWRKVTCGEGEIPRWTPPSDEPCAQWQGAAFFGGALYDAIVGPGVSQSGGDGMAGGHVYAGDLVLSVGGIEADLARRILATARVEGQPTVDGSTWVAFERGALAYEVPAWWGVGEGADRSGYSVCATLAKGRKSLPPEQVDAAHVVLREVVGDRMVTVAAPTQAVAELVMATVEVDGRARGDAPCAPEDFATGDFATGDFATGDAPDEDFPAVGEPGWELTPVGYEGISAEIPTYWAENFCNEAPQWTPYEDCTRPGEGLRLYGAGYPAALGREPRELWREDVDGRTYWTGYVLRGDVSVVITHADKDSARALLDRVR